MDHNNDTKSDDRKEGQNDSSNLTKAGTDDTEEARARVGMNGFCVFFPRHGQCIGPPQDQNDCSPFEQRTLRKLELAFNSFSEDSTIALANALLDNRQVCQEVGCVAPKLLSRMLHL